MVSPENSKAILEEIAKKGAPTVVSDLWGNRAAWESVTKKIASGEIAWIDVALALRKGSDAGASTDLHDAMFEALGRNPVEILKRLEPTYQLIDICGGRHDPLPTYKEAVDELNRTITAVRGVQETALQSKKESCLRKLQEGEGHLQRFFGPRAGRD